MANPELTLTNVPLRAMGFSDEKHTANTHIAMFKLQRHHLALLPPQKDSSTVLHDIRICMIIFLVRLLS